MSASAEPIAVAKAALRARMRERRDAIPSATRAAAAVAITRAQLPPGPLVVASYRAIGAELDTEPLEARLIAEGHILCLPAMVGRDMPLAFRLWRPGDPLFPAKWGIEEPAATSPEAEPDILFVPLLAFDACGTRLGYGGGYYDRSLKILRAHKPILAIGLAYDEQAVDAVPQLAYDQRLDWVLTPSGARRCIGVEVTAQPGNPNLLG